MKFILITILSFSLISPLSSQEPDYTKQEIDCLAQNMYYEARGESKRGMIAVGHVTMNRAKSRQFPNNICHVVSQKAKRGCQFSWVCMKKLPAMRRDTYDTVRTLAEKIYNGKIKDITYGATHFHNASIIPSWTVEATQTVQIGTHFFYKGV